MNKPDAKYLIGSMYLKSISTQIHYNDVNFKKRSYQRLQSNHQLGTYFRSYIKTPTKNS